MLELPAVLDMLAAETGVRGRPVARARAHAGDASLDSTSKTETLAYSPTIRHRWGHRPARFVAAGLGVAIVPEPVAELGA